MHKHFSRGIYLPDSDDYIKRKFRLLFHVDVFRFRLLSIYSLSLSTTYSIHFHLVIVGPRHTFFFPRFHVINYALSCLAIVVISENKMRFQIRLSTIRKQRQNRINGKVQKREGIWKSTEMGMMMMVVVRVLDE